MRTIRIVTPEPRPGARGVTAFGTKVFDDKGGEIEGVRRISISPMEVNSRITAEIELSVGSVDVTAHPLLGLDTLKEAAAAHGYRLEPKF